MRGLHLTDFRNYAEASVEFAPGLNLVVGRNGQGKTNLVEAINVLCGVGSHRGATGDAMVRHGAERAVLSGSGRAGGREVRVDGEVRRTGGTRLLVNRVPLDRLGAPGPLVAVAFSPDDLVIVKGGPEERRRLLDQGAGRLRALATAERQEFERGLRQRTGLLKAAPSSQRDLERGVSPAGPHGADLELLLDGADARVFASQGEQRSLALSLRMAERDLVAESRGEDPILLLDDIFSELDEVRREHLVAMVATSGQTIATATTGAGGPLTVERTLTVEAGFLGAGGAPRGGRGPTAGGAPPPTPTRFSHGG